MAWTIERHDFSPEAAADNGNRFLVGNGYLGIRGTLDEHGKDQLAAVNLAGIYDRVGDGWREPLNAPNPLHTVLSVDGEVFALPEKEPLSHTQNLDYRHGIASRETAWQAAAGTVTVESSRAAHMGQYHLILSRYTVTVSAPMTVEVTADIDKNIWEIYGPHYNAFDYHITGDTGRPERQG